MNQHKKELRQTVLSDREALSAEARKSKSEAICSGIVALLEGHHGLLSGGSLMTFMPFGHEADIRSVAEWCWKMGYPVIVPKTVREPRMLRLHRISGMDELAPGLWGIPEPVDEAPLADPAGIAVILVPGVAFDRQGGRVGYGGGYYDRLLEDLHGRGIRPSLIAPAFDLQIRKELPLEPHDVRMDMILTESARYTGSEAI